VIVDVHTHFLPDDMVSAGSLTRVDEPYAVRMVDGAGAEMFSGETTATGFEVGQLVDPGRRLRDMDAMGVDRQVLSPPPPFGFFHTLPAERALALCRLLNERFAATVARHPDRFLGLATVPLQEPDLAAEELVRAVRDLGLHGVEIASRVGDGNLDDPGLRPFFAAAQRLGCPVFIHSTRGLGANRLRSYHLGNLIGNPTEDAIAAASLIFGGVLDDFPGLRVYIAHGGGSCPYVVGRWDRGWRVRAEARHLAGPPSGYLHRLGFDSLTHGAEQLRYLLAAAGSGQVLLGSDYPYDMGEPDPVGALTRAGLSNAERTQVAGANAAEWFGIASPEDRPRTIIHRDEGSAHAHR
jgi:aminocarboxymuconate-semialdehyde decarboxylase